MDQEKTSTTEKIPKMDELTEIDKLRFSALVEEVKQVRSEIQSIQSAQRKMVGYSLAIAGLSISVLIKSAIQINPIVVLIFFMGIGFAFEAIALSYLGLAHGIFRLANFLMNYLSPEINSISSNSPPKLFIWEEHLRKLTSKSAWDAILLSLLGIGEFILIIVPSLISVWLSFEIYYDLADKPTWYITTLTVYIVLLIGVIIFAFDTLKKTRLARESTDKA